MNNLYYGNDISKLVFKEEELKKSGYLFFKGDKDSLYNEYNSQDLFGRSAKLIVESDIVSVSEITEILKNNGNTEIAYFNFDLNLKPNFIKLFSKNFVFKIADDKAIFGFLDNLFSPNLKNSLSYLKRFEKDEDKIYLVTMMFFTLRNLCLYYFDKTAFYKLNPYVAKKSEELSRKITLENLKKVIYIVSEADYKIKISPDKESVLVSTILFITNIK